MGNIVKFTPRPQTLSAQAQERAMRDQHARQTLAKWLRQTADLIEEDLVAVDPLAAVLVLTGRESNAVLNVGYVFDDVNFEAACRAPMRRFRLRETDIDTFSV